MTKKTLAVLALMMQVVTLASAAPVSVDQARNAAVAFVQQKQAILRSSGATAIASTLQTADNQGYYYVFNIGNDNGFVIVSASNCTEPVLAYSPVGNLDPENINPACQYMLDSYTRVIVDKQNSNATPSDAMLKSWKELTDQTFTCDPDSKAVLVQAKWDQIEPYNY